MAYIVGGNYMPKKSKMKTYLVRCKGLNNRNLVDRDEYFRAKDGKGLRNAIKSLFTIQTSEYYGYVDIVVREVKTSHLPEIRTLTIKALINTNNKGIDKKK